MEDMFHHHLEEIEQTTAVNLPPWTRGPNFQANNFLENDHYVASHEYEPWPYDYNGPGHNQIDSFAENGRIAEQHCPCSLGQHFLTDVDCLADRDDYYEYDDRARQAARGEARLTLPPRSSRSTGALIAETNSTCMPNPSREVFRGAS